MLPLKIKSIAGNAMLAAMLIVWCVGFADVYVLRVQDVKSQSATTL